MTLTSESINKLSYTDFVGLINQWNVLPGSYVTLSKWAHFSNLNIESRILEVACTTGFSSRELSQMTGCTGEGFDLSEKSVNMATYNQQKYAPEINFLYKCIDGYQYESQEKFSHIVVGASLGFFPDPLKMLEKCISLLNDGGYVLASPFYVTEAIPQELITRAKKVFEITPTSIGYKEIMKLYNTLEVVFEF